MGGFKYPCFLPSFPCSSTCFPAEGFRKSSDVGFLHFVAFPSPIYASGEEGCLVLQSFSLLSSHCSMVPAVGDWLSHTCAGWGILLGTSPHVLGSHLHMWSWARGPAWLWSTCIMCRASKWALLSCSRAKMLPLYK